MARPEVVLPPAPDYALKIRHTYRAGWEQWYLLTGDCHWDSPECYIKLLHKHLKEAGERKALWIDNGDFFEAISSRDDQRGSKGTLIEKHCGVNYLDRLVDDGIEEFRPHLDALAYMGTGNHDQAITIRRETDILQRFVDRSNELRKGLPPIHRAGYTGWIRFMFEQPNKSARQSFAMKLEHGNGGNSPVTKGTIRTARRAARTEGAMFFVSSHIHEQWALSGVVERLNESTSRVEQRKVEHIQLGSYRRDFRTDGVGTWIMQKSGDPKPIGGTWVRFWSGNGSDVCWETKPTWVDYKALPEMLRGKAA